MNKNTMVITGAGGFVGANLCRYFHTRGWFVVAVDHKASVKSWRLAVIPEIKRVAIDLCVREEVKHLIKKTQPKIVINCAAYGAYSQQSNTENIYRVNIDAVRFLLEELKGLKNFGAFIQAGSSSEYGKNCSAPKETAHLLPDSHYSVSKAAATGLIQYYGRSFGVPAWSFRMYSVYGPFEDMSRLIPKILMAAQKNKLPPLVSPSISRDFIYVDDLALAFECLIKRTKLLPPGDVYNIGTGRMTTLRELVLMVREIFGVKMMPNWGSMPNRAWDNTRWYANASKANKELDWSPRVSLEDGLKKTMKWMNKNPDLVNKAQRNSILLKQ